MNHEPYNHYWQKDDGSLFSSARYIDVQPDDFLYQAWLAEGGIATPYPKDAAGVECAAMIEAILAPLGLFPMDSEAESAATPAAARYLLNTTKSTYHDVSCSDASAGALRSLEEIAEINPSAKPCGKCNPPALS